MLKGQVTIKAEVIILVDLDAVMNTLIEISKEKLLELDKIYNLTVKQQEIIELEDIDGLNELIDKKQAEIAARREAKEL